MCTALGATVGALERGACLEGVLSMAISEVPLKWELGLGVTSLKNYNNSVPPTSQSQIFQTGSAEGSTSPELTPRELKGEAGTRSPDKCLVQAEGCTTTSFQGCLVGNGDQLLRTFEPQEPSLPPQGSMGGGAEEQAGRRVEEIILCLLARSHIKSNSFIFTFVHPAGPAGEGLAGEGAH